MADSIRRNPVPLGVPPPKAKKVHNSLSPIFKLFPTFVFCRLCRFSTYGSYIHKSVRPMLVFGRLKCRKLQIPSIKNNAKDDATGVIYIPGVCFGAFLPKHAFRAIYTQRGYLFACLYSMVFPTTTNDGRVKVQMPTFFVCG